MSAGPCLATALAVALAWAATPPARAADRPTDRPTGRDVLWRIVHNRCVPDQRLHAAPAPCIAVDLAAGEAAGTAVLKDRNGVSQYLLIPTARVTGIESPLLLAPDAPNYFAAAWRAGALVGDRLHRALPRGDLALAVNSAFGRSQDQLHIHVDCIRPDVRAALDAAEPGIDDQWRPLPLPLAGHTLVLVGDTRNGQPDLILLDGQASTLARLLSPLIRLGSGSGEQLQDHDCRIIE